MKSIAGNLRIDLAQYRELQSFAQFSTELDKATQQQLTRGEKLTELLKQNQYSPMSVEEQIAVLYAGTKGYLDDIETGEIRNFEKNLVQTLREEYQEVLEKIRKEKVISDFIEEKLDESINKVKNLVQSRG
jgi:F-type H+-transporting ATPase subunit alpha